MKKLFTLVAVASMFTFVACGPSAEEMAAKAKLVTDSIQAANDLQVAADAAKMAAADSVAKADAAMAEAKRLEDSTAAAAAAPKKGKK